jgi:hypothetical protein
MVPHHLGTKNNVTFVEVQMVPNSIITSILYYSLKTRDTL